MRLCWNHQENRLTCASQVGLSVPSVTVAGSQLGESCYCQPALAVAFDH